MEKKKDVCAELEEAAKRKKSVGKWLTKNKKKKEKKNNGKING